MSSTVDERVVAMKFDNKNFEKGVTETTTSLANLKKSMNFEGAKKGLDDLEKSGKNFSLQNIANGVDNIAQKFSALSVIGITALANITSKAVDAGLQLVKSLTIEPIAEGMADYNRKLTSVQTIMNATGESIQVVDGYFRQLDTYADKTVYNLSDMTGAFAKFTNAGVDMDKSVPAIKGIANMVALAGQGANEASIAMYNLSQSIAGGFLTTTDYKSLNLANVATKEWKTNMIDAAVAAGSLAKNADGTYKILIDGSGKTATASSLFSEELSRGWASADILMNVLGDYGNELTDIGKKAQAAAQDVKSFPMMMDTLKASVGTGWTDTFEILIGNVEESKTLFTGLTSVIQGYLDAGSNFRNNLLQMWKDIGGRDNLIKALSNVFMALQKVMMPIVSAFKEIFPPVTAGQLGKITNAFLAFSEAIQPSAETMKLLKRTFMGVFAVLDIGWMVLKQVIGLFGDLFGAVAPAGGGILEITANIGDFLVMVRDAIKDGNGLGNVFKFIGDAVKGLLGWIGDLGEATTDTLSVDSWGEAWENVAKALQKVGDFFRPILQWLGAAFETVKTVVTDFFKGLDFNVLVGLLNVGAVTGVGVLIKLALDKIVGVFKDGPGGIIKSIKGVFGAITDTFSAMQAQLKASALQKIAIAIALLTASVIALSFVDPIRLVAALGAMSVMFGELAAMMVAMNAAMKDFSGGKMAAMAATMILVASAMVILSSAVAILASMSWEELTRGLVGLGVGMLILVKGLEALTLMKGLGPKMLAAGTSILILSAALVIFATALKIMSTMSWDDIARSMATMGGALVILMTAMSKMKGSPVAAASLLIVSVALTAISGALKVFATMSWDDIYRAMTVMAASIGILVGAMMLLDLMKNAPVGAALLLAMAVALNLLIVPLKAFATFSWEEIGKAMVVLAGSLAILAGAMALMGIPLVALGGLALAVVSAGLMLLAPALAILGTMSWDAIGRGLAMLGASLAILAVGGLLLIPASVGFLLLGTAILMLGTGAFLAGTGLMMLAAGFIALAGAGALGAKALELAVMTMIGLIPMAMAAFAQGIIDFALVIAGGAIEFTAAMTTLITSLVTAIADTGPLVIETLWNLILLLVAKIVEGAPIFVDAGWTILLAFIRGIDKNLPALITIAGSLIAKFITGIGQQALKIAKAGGDTVLKFINGITAYINENSQKFVTAGSKLFRAVVDGISKAITQGGADIAYAGSRIGNALLQGAMKALGIASPSKEFYKVTLWAIKGLDNSSKDNAGIAEKSGERIGDGMLEGMKKSMTDAETLVKTDMTLRPQIRPVLDLSQYDREKKKMGIGDTSTRFIATSAVKNKLGTYSSDVATSTQTEYDDRVIQINAEKVELMSKDSGVTFVQNNNSPKALSASEIYRNTKNQISQAKGKVKDA